MSEKRYISIDIETTGLNSEKCQVLEVGAVIEDWESTISILPTFQCYVRHSEYRGEPFALAMNAKILAILADPVFPVPFNETNFAGTTRTGRILDPSVVGPHFAEWLRLNDFNYKDRLTAAGKNFGSFDFQFLKRLPNFKDVASRFRYRYIDPSMLYWNPDVDGSSLPNMLTCMKRAGIMGGVSHRAVDDAQCVIRLIRHYYASKSKWDMR